jgi:predicted outer membrane repeat protein
VDHAYFIADSTGEAGGAISTDGDKDGAIITDSYFSRNTASSEYGGSIYIDSGTGGR